MTWLISILAAVIPGVAGLFLAGCIANSCVSWYHISNREGASGYFVIFIALGGGILGLTLGLIAARVIAWNYGPGMGKELAGALGVVLLTAGVSAGLCRGLADVAPRIEGRELNLEVEFRFSNSYGAEKPPTAQGDWHFIFVSLSGQTRRKIREGTIQTIIARYENGQWIVPTQVSLFTERGGRSVTLSLCEATEVMCFLLPLPARPGPEFERWSDWIPRQQASGQPWPSDKMSCRFRVQKTVSPSDLEPH